MVEFVEELTLRPRAGGLGANKDDSGDLKDMGYAERLILEPNFLKLLSKLKVVTEEIVEEDGKKKKRFHGGTVTLSKADLVAVPVDRPELAYDPKTVLTGAVNQINKVFVAMESPLYASTLTTDDAQKVTKVRTKGEHVGESYSIKEADKIRIHKISETFDLNKYAAEGSIRTLPEDQGGEASGQHQEPTSGTVARVAKWVEENADEVFDELKAIGCGIISESQ